MKLPTLCIQRPAFTIVLSLIILLCGLLGFKDLSVSWLPRVVVPVIAINTEYAGASAKTIESQVTVPIENTLSGISGIDTITSWSRNNESSITVYFKIGTDLNAAASDIRAAVTRANSILPKDISPPDISKRNPTTLPSYILVFSDDQLSAAQLTNYVKTLIKPQFDTLPGVGQSTLYGAKSYAMRIWLEPQEMAAHGVTATDILNTLKQQNVAVPSAKVRTPERFYTVTSNFKMRTPAQFKRLIVKNDHGRVTRLSEVANVKVSPLEIDSTYLVNGKPGVALGFTPLADANPLDMVAGIAAHLKNVKRNLPQGMHVNVIYNQARFIKASIHSVYETLIEAVILVILVVIAMLGNLRASIIPIVTIPICIIGGFAFMLAAGYTINTLTLLALVLAIGLVVDDAIVMLENIARRIELGEPPLQAALKGSTEITFAIIAMTITLAAVYLPLGFTSGLTGVFFREFAFTLAATVIISGFIALTLSPMMCSRLLQNHDKDGRYQRWLDKRFHQLNTAYRHGLSWCLHHRLIVAVLMLIAIVIGIVLYKALPAMLAPPLDQNVVTVNIEAPADAGIAYTERYAPQLKKLITGIPGVANTALHISSANAADIFVGLKPQSERRLSDDQIAQLIQQRADKIAGFKISVSPLPPPLLTYGAGTGDDPTAIPFVVMTAGSYEALHNVISQLMTKVRSSGHFRDVNNLLKWNTEGIQLSIDRDLASDLGVSMADVSTTLSTMLSGTSDQLGYFQFGGENYRLIAQMDLKRLEKLNAIDNLFVRSDTGNMIPLSAFIDYHYEYQPSQLLRFNRLRADAILVKTKPGYSMGQAIDYFNTLAAQDLPKEKYTYGFFGAAKTFIQSSGHMAFIFLIAICFIYLVLVAQFESFIDPLAILLTVPFAIVGALFTLYLVGDSINFYSQIGLITLIGLISKHGVMITQFCNEKRAEGLALNEAILEAAVIRLRPILMTTFAMVLGAIPLALAAGPGAANRQQIGWVIVGGMAFGTVFSLFVVPVAYHALSRWKRT